MPLSPEQMVQAEAAKRMLADAHFLRILDRIVTDAAEKAVFTENPDEREANRQLVLAISRVRGELQADADLPEAVKASDGLAKSME